MTASFHKKIVPSTVLRGCLAAGGPVTVRQVDPLPALPARCTGCLLATTAAGLRTWSPSSSSFSWTNDDHHQSRCRRVERRSCSCLVGCIEIDSDNEGVKDKHGTGHAKAEKRHREDSVLSDFSWATMSIQIKGLFLLQIWKKSLPVSFGLWSQTYWYFHP